MPVRIDIILNLSLMLLCFLTGCGSFEDQSERSQKRYVFVYPRLIGLPTDGAGSMRFRSANIIISQCAQEKANSLQQVRTIKGRMALELAAPLDGCRVELIDVELEGKTGSQKFFPRDPDGTLQLTTGQRKLFSSSNKKTVELYIEKGFQSENNDVIDVRITFKPIFDSFFAYPGTKYVDLQLSDGEGFLFISNVVYLESSKSGRVNSFLFEFACPKQMLDTTCLQNDVMEQKFILLKGTELNLSQEELMTLATQERRFIIPKRSNFGKYVLQLTLGTELQRRENLGIIAIMGDKVRLYRVTLP